MMQNTRSPRNVLVVGGNGGVGSACADRFTGDGDKVALVARSVKSDRYPTYQADVVDHAAMDKAFEQAAREMGGLDIVVHAVGALVDWRPVRDLDPADWARFIQTDLVGSFNSIQSAIRQIRRTGRGGSIIAISSIAARMCQPRNSQGAAAKAGLEALVRVAAREEGRYGIRVNAVSIGFTNTSQGQDAIQQLGREATEKMVSRFPVPRIGEPEDISAAVAYLAGSEGSYVTGQILQVDGGQFIAG